MHCTSDRFDELEQKYSKSVKSSSGAPRKRKREDSDEEDSDEDDYEADDSVDMVCLRERVTVVSSTHTLLASPKSIDVCVSL